MACKAAGKYVRAILRGEMRYSYVFDNLPYGPEELIAHLKSTLPDGYTWDDLPDLHIDHIRPVSAFDIQKIGDPEFVACWQLDNLQMLPAAENRHKGRKTPSKKN